MSCAADRIVPIMLYLLFELQPAITMPITSSEIMASKKKSADEKLAPVHDADIGITANPAKTDANIMMGANLKSCDCDLAGVMSSF